MTKQYLTTLNTRPFLYQETIKMAKLVHEGKQLDEILNSVLKNNLFDLESEDRAERFYSEILKRLDELDIYLFNQFLFSDIQTSKAILFYALLKRDQLFYEWMRDVVWDKFLVLDWYIVKEDTWKFFNEKSRKNKTVDFWTEETRALLMNAYHQVLREAGMAIDKDDNMELQRLKVDPNIREYLIKEKERKVVEILLGELIK